MFYTEDKKLIDISTVEIIEQQFADKYVSPTATVLELGARYGTVSCIINKKLLNKQNQVSVEPDNRVWAALENNMRQNDCSFNILYGFISNTPLTLSNVDFYNGYGTQSIKDISSSIPFYTLEKVEDTFNLRFDTLVADCEGFLEEFFDQNPRLYSSLSTIILEADNGNICNYQKLFTEFENNNFRLIDSHVGYWFVWKK